MTVFVCTLFLPKTVQFHLPGTSSRRSVVTRCESPVVEALGLPTQAHPLQPSLFRPPPSHIPPPQTPTGDTQTLEILINKNGFHALYPSHLESPTVKHSQSRAVKLPKPRMSSDSHDRFFASATWKVVDANKGNGGLWNAVNAASRDGKIREHVWIGTLGMPTDVLDNTPQREDIKDTLAMQHSMLVVFCPDKNFNGHYSHFCKQILWPVFHYQIPDDLKSKAYEDHSWKHYVLVNQAFADKIIQNWKHGDVVWVHDYHLLLVPSMVRKSLPDAKIGFFLHVPFPSSEVFRCLAMRKELLEGMIGAQLVGFQIREYTRHFLQTCSRLLSVEATPCGLQMDDRFVDVDNFSIGIDPINLSHHRGREEVAQWLNILQERFKGKRVIVARDKLEQIRGVRQKLLSYELFLNKHPKSRVNTVLIQVALSSRGNGKTDTIVSDIVTRVNSLWANLTNQPVVYLKQDIDYPQYLALLTIADVLMITSQREGMNLTSHEYLFCQDGSFYPDKKHGPLILSEFTGSSSLFNGNDLSVNPWDYQQCAEAIHKALQMGEEEKKVRWENLNSAVSLHTASHWSNVFLTRLDHSYESHDRRVQTDVPRLSASAIMIKHSKSARRLFILDYEGTLVRWGAVNHIIPFSPQRALEVLNELISDGRNIVYVMSGRLPEELERHDKTEWEEMVDVSQIRDWKRSVKNILIYYLERTPGAEVEERRCSLIFHFGEAEDFECALRLAADCTSHINDAYKSRRAHAVLLDRCIIVEPIDWTKATAAQQVFVRLKSHLAIGGIQGGGIDFMMVIGDGREDEKVFNWANLLGADGTVKEVVTVSLGSRSTAASATLTQGVNGVLVLLQRLAARRHDVRLPCA